MNSGIGWEFFKFTYPLLPRHLKSSDRFRLEYLKKSQIQPHYRQRKINRPASSFGLRPWAPQMNGPLHGFNIGQSIISTPFARYFGMDGVRTEAIKVPAQRKWAILLPLKLMGFILVTTIKHRITFQIQYLDWSQGGLLSMKRAIYSPKCIYKMGGTLDRADKVGLYKILNNKK